MGSANLAINPLYGRKSKRYNDAGSSAGAYASH